MNLLIKKIKLFESTQLDK